MSDLVERLREPRKWIAEYVYLESRSYETHETDLPRLAADEIEQMREQNARLVERYNKLVDELNRVHPDGIPHRHDRTRS